MSYPGVPEALAAVRLVDPSLLSSCKTFVLNHLHRDRDDAGTEKPLLVGFNGLQGAGKTTLVAALSHVLATEHSLNVVVLSIDDFYLPRAAQASLASSHPQNKLVQHRGAPGTHDVDLLNEVLRSIAQGGETRVPRYDKSAFGGLGDRMPAESWTVVNGPGSEKARVVLLEGWCVGFTALPADEGERRWKAPSRTLQQHGLEHLLYVNERLESYDSVTASMDAFIHLDAEEIGWVYEWRLQQEHALIASTGSGMNDRQVEEFVDGYYPMYELYYESVRNGVFGGKKGRQLRAVVGRDRKVKSILEI